jgi:hypothetical protein
LALPAGALLASECTETRALVHRKMHHCTTPRYRGQHGLGARQASWKKTRQSSADHRPRCWCMWWCEWCNVNAVLASECRGEKAAVGTPFVLRQRGPWGGPPERVGRDSLGPMLPRPTRLVSASGRRPFAKLKQKARRLIARRASKAGSSGARIADATQTKLRLHTATKPGRQLWPTREGGALLMAAAVLSRS